MPAQRVLLLGVTGIDKRPVIDRLAKCCLSDYGRTLRGVDFERDCLTAVHRRGLSFVLDQDEPTQFEYWRRAWREFESRVQTGDADVTVLAMHATYVRRQYGVRLVYDPACISKFQPDLIINLIDDVYDMWWRTEARAAQDPWRGRPTIEQLLTARRVEQAAGAQLAHLSQRPTRHYVLSVKHPVEALARLICLDSTVVVYLSFPISEPRRMLQHQNTLSGIEELSAFIITGSSKHWTFLPCGVAD